MHDGRHVLAAESGVVKELHELRPARGAEPGDIARVKDGHRSMGPLFGAPGSYECDRDGKDGDNNQRSESDPGRATHRESLSSW
jgi:hypothetical protein